MSWLLVGLVGLVGLLVCLSAAAAEGDAVKVTTDSNTKLTIARAVEAVNCSVCVGQGSSRVCNTQHTIGKDENTEVDFTCSKPQDIFTVQINKNFDCSGICILDALAPDWNLFPDFKRTFFWDLKVQPTGSLQFEFPTPGLRQIQSFEQCPDKLTYSVIMYPRTGPVNIGRFCQNGTITRIQLEWKGRISLEVPKHQTPPSSYIFKYSKVDGTALAVDAVLPRGKSNTDFFSATTIPANQMMKWNFVVPPKHNFTVQFVKYNQSQCNPKNSVTVVYQGANMNSVNKTLMDDQPANYQGNFSLLLKNCAADYKGSEPMLNFQVSVFRGGIPDVCKVDLQNNEGLSLQIEKKQDPFCELGMNAVVQEKIVVPAGSQATLTFLDCPKDKLVLTATKTIECQNVSLCSVNRTLLIIPDLDPCLPPPLSQVTWVLNAPERGSVELSSPQGSLYQQVTGEQQCDGTMSALVSTADGFNIGRFCSASKGIIQRVQFSSNITVTAAADGAQGLRQNTAPVLNVSFSSEITETLIYTVSPVSMTPVPLMTPNWPGPMKPDSSLSWIVNVPEEYGAHLSFTNVSQPVCSASHAMIQIRELDSEMEMSYREDQSLDLDHNVVRSFYLNMSNCEPMEGKFAILSQLSLQKKPQKLLGIILGLVAALLAVLVIVLIAVCVALRKKKRQMTNRSSIYIPKGVASLPGDASFPKTRTNNESHVYTSIDDTMVYSNLLQDGSGPGPYNGHQVDTYHNFIGPMDKDIGYDQTMDRGPDKLPFLAETFVPSRPRTPLGPVDTMDYGDRRMVDNTLYTFKTPGDPNPVRISAVEPVLLPELEPESGSDSELYDQVYEEPM